MVPVFKYRVISLRKVSKRKFGVFYQKERPSKNDLEQNLIKSGQEKTKGADVKKLISERFKAMR